MITILENPVEESTHIAFSVNDANWQEYVIEPKQRLNIRTDISRVKKNMKVTLKGDRRTILLKTIFKNK